MADQSISQLPVAIAPLTGNELAVVVQNGITKQTSLQNVANLGGPTGPTGPQGPTGPTGPGATVQVQSTTTTAPGTNANVVNIGSPNNVFLEFFIPRGDTGTAGATGATGPQGPAGQGVPSGGTIGQFLQKTGAGQYDTGWADVPATGITLVSGTSNQITVTNGSTSPVISIADNPQIPGTAAMRVPRGTTPQRAGVAGSDGLIRFNTDTLLFEGYSNGGWTVFALGSGVTSITAGTGLNGGTITSTGTISLANTSVTAGSYGSSSDVPTFTVNAQGQLTAAANVAITPTSIGAISAVNGTAGEIETSQVGTVVTVGIPTAPTLTGPVKVLGTGVTSITPFSTAMQVWETDINDYKEVYVRNLNNGSDASADFVAYNDASDVNSYFIDMGMNSSNFTSSSYPIFTPNSGYLYTGGGLSGQQSDLFIGTSNPASDIIFFTGDVLAANQRALISGTTGNFLLNTATDTGYTLNVNGTTYFDGASLFGSTVTLNADPTSALQAATKQYVDQQVTAGLHIHEPVRVETTGNLNATYTGGGTNANIIQIANGTDITFFSVTPAVGDQFYIGSSSNGLIANTAYFVVNIVSGSTVQASLTFGGAIVSGLTNGTPTIPSVINSGVGATLTNAGTQAALEIDGIPLSATNRVMVRLQTNGAENGVYEVTTVGSGSTNWVLTRTADASIISPSDPNGLGTGDYFYTQEGLINAGDSHVLTTEPNTMIIGYTPLTYTQFSGSVDYIGGTNITVSGQTISVSGTIAATLGGTGTSTVTTGNLLYGSAANTWSKLPLGTAYKSLIVNAAGNQVEWNAIPLNQTTAVSGQLNVSNGGTGASTLTGYVKGNGTSAMTASTTIPTTALSGTISNAQLANSSITINGSSVSLGGSTTVTATATNALTIGTGLTGTSYNGSTAVTINLANTAVTPASYTNANITVDAQGRITAASNGAPGGVTTFQTSLSGLTPSTATTGAVTLAGTLGATSGGTGLTSLTTNYIPYGNGTGAFQSSANFSYNGTKLSITSSGVTSGGTLVVTDTGAGGANVLLAGNGATTPNKYIRAVGGNFEILNGAYTTTIFRLSDAGVISQSTWNGSTVGVAYGGTNGTATPTAGAVPYGTGTAYAFTAAGTTGQVLTSNGAGVPTWTTPAGGVTLANDTTTATNLYPTFAAATSGSVSTIYTGNAKLLYKPLTGELQSPELVANNGLIVNSTTVSTSYTIATGNNAMSVGPITVASGATVTVSSGQRWLVL